MLPYLLWILFGGIVGWLSTLLPWGRLSARPALDVTAGVIGATVGGCAHGRVAGDPAGTSATSVLIVLLAAVVGVLLGSFVQRRQATTLGSRSAARTETIVLSSEGMGTRW